MALPGMDPGPGPAHDWPGAVSGKFTDKLHGRDLCRMQVLAPAKLGGSHSLAQNGFAGYFTDHRGLIASEGRRQVPRQDGGDIHQWRPSRRNLSEPGMHHYEKPEGRRIVEEPNSRVCVSIREKRHIRQVESKEEYGDRPIGPRNVVRNNGLRAVDQPAREIDVSNEMARKVRPLDLQTQRNGISCRSLGDKAYRHPEYDRGFHAAGSLVVGSSFTRGNFKKTEPRNSTSVHFVMDTTRKHLKSYEEKYREQQLMEAQTEVESLTRSWEAGTLKECDEANYEDLDSDDEEAAAAGS